ncbi:CHAP domain-containing protein [Photobacterium sp. CCB-ST2H9]|uniref:CHAP domain-containing protein n=1 Tax=Photobacterium sp. CCB-ST2H9 TaxID=2912855 RepID=UPI002002A85C|nr:CHAP domain-containing protein [Photobacterium sp. CCB-ST2H9]UTM56214.1 CHAP domain-containing protein [Photobacterium sp. CCB-ST2H9]
MKKVILILSVLIFLSLGAYQIVTKVNLNPHFQVGEEIDSLNGIVVYYNGGVNHVSERNLSADGYNIGLKYQCVEFIKRYYFEYLNHRMPDTYGHAKDFFDKKLQSGALNTQRDLIQFTNGAGQLPKVSDIVVYDASLLNPYGHVAIVSQVNPISKMVEIIQQNPGPFQGSRETYTMEESHDGWTIQNSKILGWLSQNSPSIKL